MSLIRGPLPAHFRAAGDGAEGGEAREDIGVRPVLLRGKHDRARQRGGGAVADAGVKGPGPGGAREAEGEGDQREPGLLLGPIGFQSWMQNFLGINGLQVPSFKTSPNYNCSLQNGFFVEQVFSSNC